MADRYVDSNAGGANDGTTWADAFTTLAGCAAVDTAGDRIFVAHNHAESTAVAVAWNWAGTLASPTRVICANSASGAPPTTVAETGSVTVTGANDLTIANSGASVYIYGLQFTVGDASNAAMISVGGTSGQLLVFERCALILGGNNVSSDIRIGSSATGLRGIIFEECDFKFANAASNFLTTSGSYLFNGGSLLTGTVASSPLFTTNSVGTIIKMSGFNLANWGSAANFLASTTDDVFLNVRNTRLPASWTGTVNSSTPGIASVSELMNADSTDTNYRLERKTQFGAITHETTIVATGGASDGTTPISWKMVSNANAEFSHQALDSPEIVRWNETVGSAITATIESVHDSLTNIKDNEIWIEVQYLGTSGTPLSLFVDDAAADILATAADQADSSAAWTTTGLTNPNTQKLNVTFTPQEKGFIHAVVKLAQASKTVYIDPKITVS